MAADGRMRRRSRPMRTSSKMMKPRGGIRGVVNSGASSRSNKCADRGIRTHAGASASVGNIVKPGVVDSSVKPSSVDSDEEEWIYIRGCRIHRAGLRFDSKGEVYVPDSEDDESSVEVSHVVATNGATNVDLAPAVPADGAAGIDLAPAVAVDRANGVELPPAVAADGAASVDLAPMVAVDGADGMEMTPKVAARLAKKVLREDLHPEVAARLAVVLSRMEPVYHECFIDMYKVMVPVFFTPAP